MRRADYGKQLGAAAQALQEKCAGQLDLNPGEGRIVDAVAATGSYAEAARLNIKLLPNGTIVTAGLLRGEFQRLARKHGVVLPKMPHTVRPEPDGIAKIAAALGRMAAGLKAALGSKPKRKRKKVGK